MKNKTKNKELEKVRKEISKLNHLALYNIAMSCYKRALKAHKELEESDINKK